MNTARLNMTMSAAGAFALLAGCAASVEVAGPGLSPAALGSPALAIVPAPEEQARHADTVQQAVEAAAAAAGFTADPNARTHLTAAFAVAPYNVRIEDGERPQGAAIALCNRQRYVLSVAVTDRTDGRLLFRNRASTVRCGKSPEEVLPALASAAIQGL